MAADGRFSEIRSVCVRHNRIFLVVGGSATLRVLPAIAAVRGGRSPICYPEKISEVPGQCAVRNVCTEVVDGFPLCAVGDIVVIYDPVRLVRRYGGGVPRRGVRA